MGRQIRKRVYGHVQRLRILREIAIESAHEIQHLRPALQKRRAAHAIQLDSLLEFPVRDVSRSRERRQSLKAAPCLRLRGGVACSSLDRRRCGALGRRRNIASKQKDSQTDEPEMKVTLS